MEHSAWGSNSRRCPLQANCEDIASTLQGHCEMIASTLQGHCEDIANTVGYENHGKQISYMLFFLFLFCFF